MPVSTASVTERLPGRSRLPREPGRLRRAEVLAAAGVALVLAHLVLAQLTLILTAVAVLTGWFSRWRPLWLAVPAALGLTWTAAVGVPRAVAGYLTGPRQVAGYLAGSAGHPGRLVHLSAAFAGAGHWLPEQLPLALLAAAAEAAALGLAGCGLAGGEPGYRPGLIVAIRRRRTTAALSAGEVVTRDGCALGLEPGTGRPAEIPWAQAAGGVLVASQDPRAAALAAFPLAAAAARRHKTLIVVDFSGSAWLGRALSGVSEAAGLPLRRFGPAGPACYEPFRSHPPRGAARLAAQMIDWAGASDQQRQAAERCLADAFAVLAASDATGAAGAAGATEAAGAAEAIGAFRSAEAVGANGVAVLDGLIALLEPAVLRGAAAALPGHLPHRAELAERAAGSAGSLDADPAVGAVLRDQLHRLRSSPLGRWLQPPSATASRAPAASGAAPRGPAAMSPAAASRAPAASGAPASAASASSASSAAASAISLGQAVADRGGALFSLDCAVLGEPAAMIARLVVADLAAVLRGLGDQRLRADALAWVHGAEAADQAALAELADLGRAAGTVVVWSTGDAAAAAGLAGAAGVVVASGPAPRPLAAGLAECTPFLQKNNAQHVAAETLRWQEEDEFAIIGRGAVPRFLPGCRLVTDPWAGPG